MQFRVSIWAPIDARRAVTGAIAIAWALAASVALTGCDPADPEPKIEAQPETAAGGGAPLHRPGRPDDLDAIRNRADAAFAEMESPRTRSESRIGPQPWPEDLPARFPRDLAGRVVADTRRDGDRLILVDVREERDATIERYAEALRAEGFQVEPGDRPGAPTLRATGSPERAELTFHAREQVTRVEILFPGPASG